MRGIASPRLYSLTHLLLYANTCLFACWQQTAKTIPVSGLPGNVHARRHAAVLALAGRVPRPQSESQKSGLTRSKAVQLDSAGGDSEHKAENGRGFQRSCCTRGQPRWQHFQRQPAHINDYDESVTESPQESNFYLISSSIEHHFHHQTYNWDAIKHPFNLSMKERELKKLVADLLTDWLIDCDDERWLMRVN